MEPMGKLAYDMTMTRITDMRREAERDGLIAALEHDRPGRFDRLCASAGERMVSLGERLRRRGEPRWQPEENRAAGC